MPGCTALDSQKWEYIESKGTSLRFWIEVKGGREERSRVIQLTWYDVRCVMGFYRQFAFRAKKAHMSGWNASPFGFDVESAGSKGLAVGGLELSGVGGEVSKVGRGVGVVVEAWVRR